MNEKMEGILEYAVMAVIGYFALGAVVRMSRSGSHLSRRMVSGNGPAVVIGGRVRGGANVHEYRLTTGAARYPGIEYE